jgi:hypothetical protein
LANIRIIEAGVVSGIFVVDQLHCAFQGRQTQLAAVRRRLGAGGIACARSRHVVALVEANARIAHLPKPVHLWREHENSVAATTEAKPGSKNCW